ncbi:MAG: PQQ-binding-like beta-propeller repeat protein [Armatimonadetes bacterium]|nr:PQQ-binding-like beta-propeller repeat protein [Armatimonadota bacterium]
MWMALTAVLAVAAFADDVAMFRGGPAHPGVTSDQAPREFHRVKWKFPTGGRIYSSPVTANGLIYFGGDDSNVYAVDAETGVQKWMTTTGGPVNSTPAVVDGNLYVVSFDGRLYCLDALTGDIKWKFATEGERRFEAKGIHGFKPRNQTFPDLFDTFLSSPAVVDGVVYFGCGDGNIYAVNGSDGELKWKFKTNDVVHSSPAVAGGIVYAGSWDSYFYAIDAATGALKWKFQGGEDPVIHNQVGFQSSPTVKDGIVYTGCRDSNLYALDALTGKEVFRSNNQGSWVIVTPAVVGDTLLYGTSDSRVVRAMDAKTGKDKYLEKAQGFIFSSPTVAGDVIVHGTFAGTLEARDLATGKLLWSFRTDGAKQNPFWALTPTGDMNTQFVFNTQYFYLEATVKEFAPGVVFSTPLVSKGVVYFGSTDGNMYAID